MKVGSQDISSETNDNLPALSYKAIEDIQYHEKYSQEKENNSCLIQRKQILHPPLTEEEINQILSMELASQSLCNQEINSICSTTELCIEFVPPEETDGGQIDVELVLDSQEGLLVESTYVHQNYGLQMEIRKLSQDISSWLQDNISVYNKYVISDDHEECIDVLFYKDHGHNKLEQRIVLDETFYFNPQDQVFFQEPFVDLLESFKAVCYAMDGLMQNSRKMLKTYVQQQLKGEWSFLFLSLLMKVSKNYSCSHLLHWLHWKLDYYFMG